MNKTKLIIFSILLAFTLSSPINASATELENSTEETATEELTTEESEEVVEETITEETSETITEEPITEIPESTPTLQEETKTNTVVSEAATYGWLNFNSEIICKPETEVIIEFEFTNKDTNEIITKEITSSDNFSNIVKLPLGEYSVKLTDSKYEDFVIYEKNITIDKKEVIYDISINITNLETDSVDTPDDKEEVKEENDFIYLLKNNFIFIILLLGCGGFLLFKDIKKNN